MSHDKVVAFCEPNKCKVEVDTKESTDSQFSVVNDRLTSLENGNFNDLSANSVTADVGNFKSNAVYYLRESPYLATVITPETIVSDNVSNTLECMVEPVFTFANGFVNGGVINAPDITFNLSLTTTAYYVYYDVFCNNVLYENKHVYATKEMSITVPFSNLYNFKFVNTDSNGSGTSTITIASTEHSYY